MNSTKNVTLTEDLNKIYFVKKNNSDPDELSDMAIAFQNGYEYFPYENSLSWITEKKCLKLKLSELTKKNVFVMEEFAGAVFEYLQQSKALVLGPRIFMSCLIDGTPVPIGSTPVYTAAMQKLVVSVSGLSNNDKQKIKELINWMGGQYIQNITMACTHLVSNTVRSTKYEKAAETKSVQIMHPDWIYDVWEISKKSNVLATDEIFEKHRLPIFFKLNFTSTCITQDVKLKLKKIIEQNGGVYKGEFKAGTTDILLLEENGKNSEKYKAAVRNNKVECIKPQWVFDSEKQKYAIEMTNYKILHNSPSAKTSTPDKNFVNNLEFSIDCSRVTISDTITFNKSNLVINETTLSGINPIVLLERNKTISNILYKEIVSNLNINQAKKSGQFLDYCCLYLIGFSESEKDKLNKIINNAGAVRYGELDDNIKDKITHIIVGEPSSTELIILKEMTQNFKNCVAVTIEWLVESMKNKRPVDECVYLYRLKTIPADNFKEPEIPSPASKKNLHSMTTNKKKISKFMLDDDPKPSTSKGDYESVDSNNSNEILQQYLQKTNLNKTVETSISETEPQTSIDPEQIIIQFLKGIKISFVGLTFSETKAFVDECLKYGAEILDECFSTKVDFLIVPTILNSEIPDNYKANNIVNILWIESSLEQCEIVDMEYYYEPFYCQENCKPLKDLNVVISTYTDYEKIYLFDIALAMGANVEDVYNRKLKPVLVCPSPTGQKYKASIKWGLPAVTSKWLLECAREKTKIPFKNYMVGVNIDSSDIIPCTQDSTKSVFSNKRKSNETSVDELNNIENLQVNSKVQILSRTIENIQLASGNSNLSPASERVKDFATPDRQLLYKGWKEREKLIAEGKIKARTLNSPLTPVVTPEELKTPDAIWGFTDDSTPNGRARNKRMFENLTKFSLEPWKKPSDKKVETPFSEVKKRFWKEALGDEYVEYGTQIRTQLFIEKNEELSSKEMPSQGTCPEEIKKLHDFIKARPIEKKSHEKVIEEDSIPSMFNSEVVGTENERIGWYDPTEFNELRRKHKEPMEYEGVPYFILSTEEMETKDKIIKQILELGGKTCDLNVKFDLKCTHVVCETLKRGEKVISAIASGKWLLGLNYIKDSIEAGYFLKEELYEWGNPKAIKLPQLNELEQSIANAAHRWRNKILKQDDKKDGVFTGFRVILHVARKEQFQCVIKAGGGTVIDAKPPYERSDEALNATHCFVEEKRTKLNSTDHKVLAEAGVRILTVMYINAYLLSDTTVNESMYTIKYN